ncbi:MULTISPECIES: class I SAM-dependent methyltransferase [unclassified Streptomyces]|uniref:class I SAM-dependent methyltransferase n=1 Tax=unclassified Streptomyces TaxID=2593676 RepID=UPI002D21E0BF|nr:MULTISPECIES: methyltransferase domain-containing protein [unclassified Streptomyces]
MVPVNDLAAVGAPCAARSRSARGRLRHDMVARRLLEELPCPRARILDVGCGDGEMTLRLAVAGHRATGPDPSSGMLRAAAERVAADPRVRDAPVFVEADPRQGVRALHDHLPGGWEPARGRVRGAPETEWTASWHSPFRDGGRQSARPGPSRTGRRNTMTRLRRLRHQAFRGATVHSAQRLYLPALPFPVRPTPARPTATPDASVLCCPPRQEEDRHVCRPVCHDKRSACRDGGAARG